MLHSEKDQYTTRDQFEKQFELDPDCFFFYDWFCKDSSLQKKATALLPKVKKFVQAANVDIDNTYFFYKNNCPVSGSLYDDFRICNKVSGDVIWTVTPKSGHRSMKGQGELWGSVNKFDGALVQGSFQDILDYFKQVKDDQEHADQIENLLGI